MGAEFFDGNVDDGLALGWWKILKCCGWHDSLTEDMTDRSYDQSVIS
jgi:hypothetical protein